MLELLDQPHAVARAGLRAERRVVAHEPFSVAITTVASEKSTGKSRMMPSAACSRRTPYLVPFKFGLGQPECPSAGWTVKAPDFCCQARDRGSKVDPAHRLHTASRRRIRHAHGWSAGSRRGRSRSSSEWRTVWARVPGFCYEPRDGWRSRHADTQVSSFARSDRNLPRYGHGKRSACVCLARGRRSICRRD